MTERSAPVRAATRRPVPDDLFGGRLKDCFLLDLEIAAIHDSRPTVRTITFTSSDLIDFEWKPGQDVMFEIDDTDRRTRRRYTIRRGDPTEGTLDIDVVLHGSGPFATWAANASIGDHVDGIGPRGVVTLRDGVTDYLFIADESAIPFTFAMIEAMPAGTTVTAIVATDDAQSPPRSPSSAADVDMVWTSDTQLIERLSAVSLAPTTVAYVNGEHHLVRQCVRQLEAQGMTSDAINMKAYWRRDQANAAHGEPSKD